MEKLAEGLYFSGDNAAAAGAIGSGGGDSFEAANPMLALLRRAQQQGGGGGGGKRGAVDVVYGRSVRDSLGNCTGARGFFCVVVAAKWAGARPAASTVHGAKAKKNKLVAALAGDDLVVALTRST